MVSVAQLKAKLASQSDVASEYCCRVNLNLYDSPTCERLATQAAAGRHLKVLSLSENATLDSSPAIQIRLCEDDYLAWLPITDINNIEETDIPYQAIALSQTEINQRLPAVIAFTQDAMKQSNYYLWGGTVAPNYDCSGLMQAAFASEKIWLPRDSYQQEIFTQRIKITELQPADLVFFGTPEKVNHVGLYLGEGRYIHSSGKEVGRNGIGIDSLSEQGDEISRGYYQRLRSFGRVVSSYQPKEF